MSDQNQSNDDDTFDDMIKIDNLTVDVINENLKKRFEKNLVCFDCFQCVLI